MKETREKVCDFIETAYQAYLGVHFGDQDKSWAPHLLHETCLENLRQWSKRQRKCLVYEGNHSED